MPTGRKESSRTADLVDTENQLENKMKSLRDKVANGREQGV